MCLYCSMRATPTMCCTTPTLAPTRRITTFFVGAFLSAIFNLLLIVFLGTTAFELQPVVGNRRGAGTTKTGATTGTATV